MTADRKKRKPMTIKDAAGYLKSIPFHNLIFDLDDTLYLRSDPYIRAYEKCFKRQIAAERSWPDGALLYRVSRGYGEEEYKRRISGEINMREMLINRTRRSFLACGISLTDEEALHFEKTYEEEQSSLQLLPEYQKLLEELSKASPAPFLGILTNGPSAHQWNKIRVLGLARWIPEENIVVSGDAGFSKPDIRLFRYYEEKCRIDPGQTLMIGDSLEADVTGADNAGWHSLWVQ